MVTAGPGCLDARNKRGTQGKAGARSGKARD